MNIFPQWFRRWAIGALSNPDSGYQNSAVHSIHTKTGTSVSDENALKLSAVWGCVQLISNAVVGLPIDFYRTGEDSREKLKSRHFLTDLFKKSPNMYMKPRDFRSAMTVQMCLWQNAYAEIKRQDRNDPASRPVSITPLRPGRMIPFISPEGRLTYHYQTDEGVIVYAKEDIFHLKGFGTDGIVGAGRTDYAREEFGLAAAARDFGAAQFANGGRPGGVLQFSEYLKDDEREAARKLYEGISEGALNKGKVWALEGGVEYKALDYAADQMQMIATREKQDSAIARYFGVPGVLIGVGDTTSSAWPASFEQQMLAFLTLTVKAYLDEWEATINDSLCPNGIESDHDTAPLVKMDGQSAANYWSRMAQNGLATRNEGRVRMGLPKSDDPNADKLTIQSNLQPVEDLGENGSGGNANVSETQQSAGTVPTEIRQ